MLAIDLPILTSPGSESPGLVFSYFAYFAVRSLGLSATANL
jgi:hypothetical protein